MYIFNPDNDLALANFNPHFTAPASARTMRHNLALLPVWYAPSGSLVVAEGVSNRNFLQALKDLLPINSSLISYSQVADYADTHVKPWGWNPSLRKQLIQWGINQELLPSLPSLELLRNYSGRQHAVKLLSELTTIHPLFCGESYYFADSNKLLAHLHTATGNQVLKMPYSGSGKGLVWVRGAITDKQTDWCNRVIKMQGGVVVEPVLNKVQDFAMEFQLTNLGAQFVGYSLFQSAPSGAYMGNVLLTDADIQDRLSHYIDRSLLLALKDLLTAKLSRYFPHYRGYLGVDMLVCQTSPTTYQLQPCIEINMRMNMGLVAHRINTTFVHPHSWGLFSINYFNGEGQAYKQHIAMQSNKPLIIENGKIISGYLALTPVDENTNYTASISINKTPV